MMRKGWAIALLSLVVVSLLLSLWLRPPAQQMLGLEPQTVVPMQGEPGCDVAITACRARLDGKQLRLQLQSGLSPLQPFAIRLQAEGWQPQQVVVYFSMQGMEMGLNRFVLQGADGEWRGRGMLPVCTQRRSDWVATVFVSEGGLRYRAEFGFTTAGR